MLKQLFREPKALIIAIIAFVAVLTTGIFFINLANENYLHDQRQLLQSTVRSQASEIERSLSFAFTATQILAHQIEVDQTKIVHFESYAENIMNSIPGIDNLQLAPKGIVKHIYPLQGNETALGLDVLNHPRFRDAAYKAIEERRMIAVGPIKLVQGGIAVISRTPIFTSTKDRSKANFWGFSSALILIDPLLSNAGIYTLEGEGYSIRLIRPLSEKNIQKVIYASNRPISKKTMVSADITLPTGKWELLLSRDLNYSLERRKYYMILITLILALVCGLGLFSILIRPKRLQVEVQKKTLELQKLAYNDPLTGLPNRRYLNDVFSETLKDIIDNQKMGAVIYFDLDNFKSINDSIGHDVGDKVLQVIALRLGNLQSESCRVVRLGGDEFAILLAPLESLENIENTARDILHITQKTIKLDHREYKQSTSLGIALIPDHGDTVLELMQCADTALYQAKRLGKNQYACFTETMREQSIHSHQEELALSKAIQSQQLVLFFQPQLDLKEHTIVGAEALVRWNHPTKGIIYPDQFIHLAEQSGLILELGRDVIRQSFAYQARRQQLGLPAIMLHINLSAVQLSDTEFVPFVEHMILYYRVPGHSIGFELTETTILTDLSLAQVTLEKLKQLGICVAIDDFGTGFSSLGQLKNLPVDLLKIDRSFVRELDTNQEDKMMVEAIIAMAHKLGLDVVAEGIESETHLTMLEQLGCDIAQGYFIARPIPEQEFNAFSLVYPRKQS